MHVLFTPSWYASPTNLTHGSFFREQAHALQQAGLRVGVISPKFHRLTQLPSWRKLTWGMRFWDDDGVATWMQYEMTWLPKLPFVGYLE